MTPTICSCMQSSIKRGKKLPDQDIPIEYYEEDEDTCPYCNGEARMKGRTIDEHNAEGWYECVSCGKTWA